MTEVCVFSQFGTVLASFVAKPLPHIDWAQLFRFIKACSLFSKSQEIQSCFHGVAVMAIKAEYSWIIFAEQKTNTYNYYYANCNDFVCRMLLNCFETAYKTELQSLHAIESQQMEDGLQSYTVHNIIDNNNNTTHSTTATPATASASTFALFNVYLDNELHLYLNHVSNKEPQKYVFGEFGIYSMFDTVANTTQMKHLLPNFQCALFVKDTNHASMLIKHSNFVVGFKLKQFLLTSKISTATTNTNTNTNLKTLNNATDNENGGKTALQIKSVLYQNWSIIVCANIPLWFPCEVILVINNNNNNSRNSNSNRDAAQYNAQRQRRMVSFKLICKHIVELTRSNYSCTQLRTHFQKLKSNRILKPMPPPQKKIKHAQEKNSQFLNRTAQLRIKLNLLSQSGPIKDDGDDTAEAEPDRNETETEAEAEEHTNPSTNTNPESNTNPSTNTVDADGDDGVICEMTTDGIALSVIPNLNIPQTSIFDD